MKIPIVTATEQAPTSIPVTVRPGTAGMEYAALGELGGDVATVALQVSEEDRRWREKKKSIDMETAITTAQLAQSEENENIVTDLRKNPDPENYQKNWDYRWDLAAGQRTAEIKDPETRARVQNALQRMKIGKSIEETNYGRTLWVHTKQGEIYRNIDSQVETGNMVGANKSLDDAIVGGIFDPATAQRLRQHISDKNKVREEKVRYSVAMMDVRRDPRGARERMDSYNLSTENMARLDAAIDTQFRINEAERTREEASAKKAVEDTQKQIRNVHQGLVEKGLGGEAIENARYLRDQGFLNSDDVKWVETEVDAYNKKLIKGEVPENEANIKKVYDLIDQQKFNDAKALAKATEMKSATYAGILERIRSHQEQWENKNTADTRYRHSQGMSQLMKDMGILEGTMIEKLDPITQEVVSLATREFNSRSMAVAGKEDPYKVAAEIGPKYQQLLSTRKKMGVDNYRSLLRFGTPQELEDAHKKGLITDGEYNSQKDIARRYLESVRIMQDKKEAEKRAKEK